VALCSVITKIFSPVVLMAVADTNYRFVYVDLGSYGKECGSTFFKRSTLWTSIQTNMLELPCERPLAGTEGPNVPHFFVVVEGFALSRNTLRPFGGSNLNVKTRIYNYRLCRTRRCVCVCVWNVLLEFSAINGEFSIYRFM
jgi:hypothetical protein